MTPTAAASATSSITPTVPAPGIPTIEDEVAADVFWPPTDLESDEPPLETILHLRQMILLLNCLNWLWRDRDDYFAAGNLTVYYSPRKRKDEMFRGPDFFVALDTTSRPRKSWMIWEEDGKYPNLIVELLSSSTAEVDRDLKKTLYAETFRTPEYFWFDPDPDSLEFKGFALTRGHYEPISPDESGRLWSEQLQLYLGIHSEQLRFFTASGELVPSSEEAAIAAEEAAIVAEEAATVVEEALDTEKKHSAQLQERADQLADKLRELGIDPDSV